MHPLNKRAEQALQDPVLMRTLPMATRRAVDKQRDRWNELPDVEALRDRAQKIKRHTIRHLDHYLTTFEAAAQANGIHVHWASTHEEAVETVRAILDRNDVRVVAKAKSMATEEMALRERIEETGREVWETDLGEFIVQISGRPPSHITAPAIHEDTASISRLFHDRLGTPMTDDPERLARIARDHLRKRFRQADCGVSGANFLVAENGRIVLVENEANIRLATTLPRVHVVVAGIEKLVPRMSDVPVFLKLLARSATGQKLTSYTHDLRGPRRQDETEGPDEMHVVLLDAGRTRILADEAARDTLDCIRCGSCLNVCPVYQAVGGHTYGGVYAGPIGAILRPQLEPDRDTRRLPYASTLCGACESACPVKIPIPDILLHLRTRAVGSASEDRLPRPGWVAEKATVRAWYRAAMSPRLWRLGGRFARLFGSARPGRGSFHSLPPPLSGWTKHREFPRPAPESFHTQWDERKRKKSEENGRGEHGA